MAFRPGERSHGFGSRGEQRFPVWQSPVLRPVSISFQVIFDQFDIGVVRMIRFGQRFRFEIAEGGSCFVGLAGLFKCAREIVKAARILNGVVTFSNKETASE